MFQEMRAGLRRFWGLSWWIKGPIMGLAALLIIGGISSALSGGRSEETTQSTPSPAVVTSPSPSPHRSPEPRPSPSLGPTPSPKPSAERTATPLPTEPPTPNQPPATEEPQPTEPPPTQPVPSTTVQLTVVGAPPGGNASASVQTSPGASCSITYVTPSGAVSGAQGLEPKTADANGFASWTWKIGPSTKPGTGTVKVTCDCVTASKPLQIG